ncbi:MAG: class I SAM-dependent DNA methyltransferase, partial [Bacteroidota bacterium]
MFNTSTTITYRNPLENAVSKIFALFHVLWESGRFNSPDETTQAVLILLSLFKDGIIRTDAVYSDESLDSLKKTLDSLTNGETGRSQYKEILPLFSEQLSKLDKHTYYRFCHALGQIDIGFLRDNFAVVFDEVLYRTAESYGQNSGLSILPVELTRFMIRLSNLSKHARVYNPFAGLASFGVHLNEGQSYLGQELHMKSWALGSLRLLAHDRFGSAEYIHADSISHWPKYAEKYDLIITAPPFGLRLDKERAELNSWDYTTFEQFLLLNAVKSLNEKGVFIGFLPLGFLSSEGPNKELRKKLMNEDLIDMIVSIPGGLLYNT